MQTRSLFGLVMAIAVAFLVAMAFTRFLSSSDEDESTDRPAHGSPPPATPRYVRRGPPPLPGVILGDRARSPGGFTADMNASERRFPSLAEQPLTMVDLASKDADALKAINTGLWWERQRMWECTEEALADTPADQRVRLNFDVAMDVVVSGGTGTVTVLDASFPEELSSSVRECYLAAWDNLSFESPEELIFAYRVEYPVMTWRAAQ